MDRITIIWSMCLAAFLFVAAIHFAILIKQRNAWWRLYFVLASAAASILAGLELYGMHLQSVEEYSRLLRWALVIFSIQLVSLMWFIRSYLNAGRPWLAWLATGVRAIAVAFVVFPSSESYFNNITRLNQISFLGQTVTVPVAAGSYRTLVGQLGLVLILAFCVDASITAWRKDDRRKSLLVGVSTVSFILFVFIVSALVIWGYLSVPFTYTPIFLLVILAMGFELTRDIMGSQKLGLELEFSKEHVNLAVTAAQLGIWNRNLVTGEFRVSPEWKQIFGLLESEPIDYEGSLVRSHPEDQVEVRRKQDEAIVNSAEYSHEYRIIRTDADTRWIAAYGKVTTDNDGKAVSVSGVTRDITDRKLAEEEAIVLGDRLEGARANERTRLARELHDDLSQSLAILSTELQIFGQQSTSKEDSVNRRMQEFSGQVFGISVDVHRMSHELMPSNLERLGLVSAIDSFCAKLERVYGISIEFEHSELPEQLPEEIKLCLFRIVQEALQNVAKHSKVTSAKVVLRAENDRIELSISDEGVGFDSESIEVEESVGLMGMRERIRLLGGTFSVRSKIAEGTSINASIPFCF